MKNTDTASSEMILTERNGCRDCMVPATSCTHSETVMRCTNPSNITINSIIPLDRVEDDDHDLLILRNEERPTDTPMTVAMSSSLENCASAAASRSSAAIRNETEYAKSAPSDVIVDEEDMSCSVATSSEIKKLVCEEAYVSSMIASSILPIHHLLCEDDEMKNIEKKPLRREGGDRNHRYQMAVFGCSLQSVRQFANGGCNLSLAETSRRLTVCLTSLRENIKTCSGRDAHFLLQGVSCFKVINTQARLIHQKLRVKRRFCYRYGSCRAAIGLSSSVMFALEMLLCNKDRMGILKLSADTLFEDAICVLVRWRNTSSRMHGDALCCECRALKRGRMAWIAGKREGHVRGLSLYNQSRLQIEMIRRAMFPRNVCIQEDSQQKLIHDIQSSDFVDSLAGFNVIPSHQETFGQESLRQTISLTDMSVLRTIQDSKPRMGIASPSSSNTTISTSSWDSESATETLS